MTRSRIKAIDQPSPRCMDKSDLDASDCIASYIEEELGCNPQIHGSRTSIPSRLCNSSTQLRHLNRISKELSRKNANGIYKATGCMASCEKYRGRMLFAGGNRRRSGAISAGKSFTTAVHLQNRKDQNDEFVDDGQRKPVCAVNYLF